MTDKQENKRSMYIVMHNEAYKVVSNLLAIIFVVCLCFSYSINTNAQITFQKTFGGTAGYSVQQTTDGGYIITGTTYSFGAGDADVYLIKINYNGDTLWTKTYGGTDRDEGYSVQQTTDGGYIIAGVRDAISSPLAYLIKTDSIGNLLWAKTYGGLKFNFVQQTTDGGYIITGETSLGAGQRDVYLVKTDSNGIDLWTKTFGGTNDDYGKCVQQTTGGDYIITGWTKSFGVGVADVYLIKTDVNGSTLWTKTFGGTGDDYGESVQQTIDDGYIIAGYTNSFGIGGNDIYLIKTNSNGDTLWTRTYGSTVNERGFFIQQTMDGGYIITGGKNVGGGNNVFLVKIDTNKNIVWAKTYAGSWGGGYSVQQTNDAGYIISGGIGGVDVFLVKTDTNGNSGCNQSSITLTIGNPSTLVGSGVITGVGGSNNNSTTITGNPSHLVNILCFSCNSMPTFTVNNVTCFAGNNGNATATQTGGTPPYSYNWSNGDTVQNTDSLTAGSYLVTVTDYLGCIVIDSVTVTEPALIFTTGSATICSNDSIFLGGIYQNTSGTYYDTLLSALGCDSVIATILNVNPTYFTNAPDIYICDGDSAMIFGNYHKTAGTYYDTVSSVNGCDSVITTTLTVNPLPTISFTDLNTSYCLNDAAVILTGTPSGGTFSGTGISGNQFDPAVVGAGTHIIIYSYTDGNGCTDNVSQNVTVNNCTGIENFGFINTINIYPNPNTGEFTIEFDLQNITDVDLKILNVMGQAVYAETLSSIQDSYQKHLDLNEFAKGVYTLELIANEGIINRKIIIE